MSRYIEKRRKLDIYCGCAVPEPDGMTCRICKKLVRKKMGTVGRVGISPDSRVAKDK